MQTTTITHNGKTYEIIKSAAGHYALVNGSTGVGRQLLVDVLGAPEDDGDLFKNMMFFKYIVGSLVAFEYTPSRWPCFNSEEATDKIIAALVAATTDSGTTKDIQYGDVVKLNDSDEGNTFVLDGPDEKGEWHGIYLMSTQNLYFNSGKLSLHFTHSIDPKDIKETTERHPELAKQIREILGFDASKPPVRTPKFGDIWLDDEDDPIVITDRDPQPDAEGDEYKGWYIDASMRLIDAMINPKTDKYAGSNPELAERILKVRAELKAVRELLEDD